NAELASIKRLMPGLETQLLSKDEEPTENAALVTNQGALDFPAKIKDWLTDAARQLNAEKDRLIDLITSNARNGFTRRQLLQKPIDELRRIAALANPDRSPTYFGLAPTIVPKQEPLPMPTLNFDPPGRR